MFLAYVYLRSVAGGMDLSARHVLWSGGFEKFFPWIWMQVVILLTTVCVTQAVSLERLAGTGMHVHVMHLTGMIMVMLFALLHCLPWRAVRVAQDANDPATTATHLDRIRQIVLSNLCLRLLTSLVDTPGRFWG